MCRGVDKGAPFNYPSPIKAEVKCSEMKHNPARKRGVCHHQAMAHSRTVNCAVSDANKTSNTK